MKNNIPKNQLAVKSLELANHIKDRDKRYTCLAAIYAFATKYFDKENEEKLLEVLKMSDLLTKYVEEEVQKGKEKGIAEGKAESKKEIAKNLIEMDFSIDDIAKATGLKISDIEQIKMDS